MGRSTIDERVEPYEWGARQRTPRGVGAILVGGGAFLPWTQGSLFGWSLAVAGPLVLLLRGGLAWVSAVMAAEAIWARPWPRWARDAVAYMVGFVIAVAAFAVILTEVLGWIPSQVLPDHVDGWTVEIETGIGAWLALIGGAIALTADGLTRAWALGDEWRQQARGRLRIASDVRWRLGLLAGVVLVALARLGPWVVVEADLADTSVPEVIRVGGTVSFPGSQLPWLGPIMFWGVVIALVGAAIGIVRSERWWPVVAVGAGCGIVQLVSGLLLVLDAISSVAGGHLRGVLPAALRHGNLAASGGSGLVLGFLCSTASVAATIGLLADAVSEPA